MVTCSRLVGLQCYEFEVVIIAVGAGTGRGSLGVRLASGALSTCMQHSINVVVEGS